MGGLVGGGRGSQAGDPEKRQEKERNQRTGATRTEIGKRLCYIYGVIAGGLEVNRYYFLYGALVGMVATVALAWAAGASK